MWLLDLQCSYGPAQRQAARVAEPVGEAHKWKGSAAMFRHGREDILSSAFMTLISSGGFNVSSRCAYSLPGLFKGEMGAHLRDQGSVLWEVFFLTIPSTCGGRLCVVLLGSPLTQSLCCHFMLICVLVYLTL